MSADPASLRTLKPIERLGPAVAHGGECTAPSTRQVSGWGPELDSREGGYMPQLRSMTLSLADPVGCYGVGPARAGRASRGRGRALAPARLGHASPAASYRYLHAVDGRDAEITSALSELAAHGDAAKLPRSIVVRH